ncbi:MAG: hypothetical protein VX970_08600 [Planctomycetota bacterium]|nr:hypothetical protein [Planctomycetota bacterium]
MRHHARFLLLSFCSLLLFTNNFATIAVGDDDPSVAVVSVSSYEKLMGHAAVIGEIVGFPNAEQMIQLQIMQLTGGKPLAGLDQTKPIVIDVRLGQVQPYWIACLPVNDFQAMLGSLPAPLAATEDAGDGVLLLKATDSPMYAKTEAGWTFLSDLKENLTTLPKDPVALAGDLPSKYVMAGKVNMQSVPAEKRAELLGFLELMSQLQMAGAAEPGADLAAQQAMMKDNIARLKQWIDETVDVTIGVAINGDDKNFQLDFSTTASAGTQTAKSYERFQKGKSAYAGFLDVDAAIAGAVHLTGKPAEDEMKYIDAQGKVSRQKMMEEIENADDLTDDQKEVAKQSLGKLMNVMFDTMRSDSFQAGFAVMLNKQSSIVMGAQVSDGDAVESALKPLIEMISQQGGIPGPDWEAENHAFHRIHTWKNIPVPDEDSKKVIGDQLEVAIGVNAESVYLAMGGNGIEDLKKVIDASAKASDEVTEPAEAVLHMGTMMQFAVELDEENGAMYLPIAGMLQEEDAVRYGIQQIENGLRARITVEQNILRAMPLMSMTFGAAMPDQN